MKSTPNKCPNCKRGKLYRGTKKQTHTYKGKSIVIDQPGNWCNVCNEGLLTGSDIKATKKIICDFHAVSEGLLTSKEVRKIRKYLKLTQKDAAQICGGGPNAFSRYERGEAIPIRATSNLLKLLAKHPEEVLELLLKKDVCL